MVFVGNGGAEEGHDAVAEHLVHRAFKAVHRLHHEVNGGIEELLGGFGVEAPDQLGRVFQIGKQYRHLLAFTFQSGAGRDNFLGEVRRGVGERRLRGCLCGRGGGWRRGPRLTRPDQHGPLFIHREPLALNEFGLHVLQIVVIEVELALERTIRHPLPLTEHVNHLIEDGVKVHRGSSCTGGGQYGPAATYGPKREATYYMYCKEPAKESRKEGGHDTTAAPLAP